MQGFFKGSTLAQVTPKHATQAACGACGLYKTCNSPKLPATGNGRKGILLVVPAPSGEDDDAGQWVTGDTGKFLRGSLSALGVDLREDCWVTGGLICKPTTTTNGDNVRHCLPNLRTTIETLRPYIIIPFGQTALTAVMSILWREDPGSLTQWVGYNVPSREANAWVVPNYEPTEVGRSYEDDVSRVWFKRYLEEALAHKKRPWPKGQTEYKPEVQRIVNPEDAAKALRRFIQNGNPIAFDYEATSLKPDWPHSEIISCAVSDGTTTIAYPWVGAAVEATRLLLVSPIPKLGANIKFEERWTRREFGHGVRAWYWDSMLGAHVWDGRRGVCGLKFQCFVELGVPVYNAHIERFLQSDSNDKPNRIKTEIALHDLLGYNGLDAAIEYELGMAQMKKLLYPLPTKVQT
jgi:uracil-DNA glycosylase family 4